MSDDDHEVDVESDYDDDSDARHSSTSRNSLLFTQEDEDSDTRHSSLSRSSDLYSQAEKRAHHNALERKRRDHIKDSFSSLRKSVPTLSGEKASRAQILRKAADYIILLRKRNVTHQKEIQDLKRQNSLLEEQVRILEAAAKKRKTLSAPMLESEIDSDLSC